MEVLGYGLSGRHGCKVGGVGALLLKTKLTLLCREGPNFSSPLFLQVAKGAVPAWCWWSVQGWSSEHWARHRLLETGRWHPHLRWFPPRCQHWVGKCARMALNVASLNARGLRDASKCAHLLAELSNLCVDVAAVQKTHFTCETDCRVLENDFVVYSAFGCCPSAGVSLLVGRSLDAIVNVVFAGDGDRLLEADVAVKTFEFRIAVVYAPNTAAERRLFLRWLGSFLNASKWTVLVGDWNVILDRWSGRLGFNPRSSHTKDFKMVLDTSFLNTQQYKVRIKGKVEQSREKSSPLPYTSV